MDDEIAEFVKCVSAITLKEYPGPFLIECLCSSDIDLSVGLTKAVGVGRKHVPWLSIGELSDRDWVSKIRSAHLWSDALSDPYDLYALEGARDLTIHVTGSTHSPEDVFEFAKVLNELKNLKALTLIFQPGAAEWIREDFADLLKRFPPRIEVEGKRPKRKKKPLSRAPGHIEHEEQKASSDGSSR